MTMTVCVCVGVRLCTYEHSKPHDIVWYTAGYVNFVDLLPTTPPRLLEWEIVPPVLGGRTDRHSPLIVNVSMPSDIQRQLAMIVECQMIWPCVCRRQVVHVPSNHNVWYTAVHEVIELLSTTRTSRSLLDWMGETSAGNIHNE